MGTVEEPEVQVRKAYEPATIGLLANADVVAGESHTEMGGAETRDVDLSRVRYSNDVVMGWVGELGKRGW